MKTMFHDKFSVSRLKAAIHTMKDPSDAFNPMNPILLTNQFELKLFIRLGPNKKSAGLFFSVQEIFTEKNNNKQK